MGKGGVDVLLVWEGRGGGEHSFFFWEIHAIPTCRLTPYLSVLFFGFVN